MSKRPSLADHMKVLEQPPVPPAVAATGREGEGKGYHAATREGKARVTTPLSPADHVRLKRLALDQTMARGQRTTIEQLMAEALADLFAKYKA